MRVWVLLVVLVGAVGCVEEREEPADFGITCENVRGRMCDVACDCSNDCAMEWEGFEVPPSSGNSPDICAALSLDACDAPSEQVEMRDCIKGFLSATCGPSNFFARFPSDPRPVLLMPSACAAFFN